MKRFIVSMLIGIVMVFGIPFPALVIDTNIAEQFASVFTTPDATAAWVFKNFSGSNQKAVFKNFTSLKTATYGIKTVPKYSGSSGGVSTHWIVIPVTKTGTIKKISFAPYEDGTYTVYAALYTADYQTRLELSATTYSSVTAATWYDFVVNTECTAGTSYSVAVSASAAHNFGYTSTASYNRFADNGVQCPDSALTADSTITTTAWSIYITVEYYE